ncbi:uncharacterized protein LOC126837951 [Adelges cooleyi]|uniref:uncharacterized protein LOC126837951 n=1 Tax=Adelges cooleyi TaxID=133065 RepID=UPI00217FFE3A|nr:uncharacterized protein LOC126837951 [Adelges cooleyi]
MIADMSAFLLCCFAVTSNIKKIQSVDNKIYPMRFLNKTLPENYVHTVKKCKTFNKHRIVITPAYWSILSSPSVGSSQVYSFKLKSQVKFEKKVQDIKCSFCAITKSNILHLKDLVEKLKSREPFVSNQHDIERVKKEAEIIVRLLLLGNVETGKWLWSYFLKIIAISKYDDNATFINENPFDDEQLQTDVSDFIENCIAEKYLPVVAMESDFVWKNTRRYVKMFRHLRLSEGFLGVLLGPNYNATIEFLYLKPFWDDQRQLLLFGQITGANVDWSTAKQRHEVEVSATREFVENRTWIYKPYGRHVHQQLLINIIDARIYCYLSVVLHVYEKNLPIHNGITVTLVKYFLKKVIYAALELTAYKDDFLVGILSEIKMLTVDNIDDIKDILVRVKAKANGILNDLNGTSTSRIDRLGINVDEPATNSLIRRFIKKFEDFLTDLKDFLPVRYKLILHFMDVVKMPTVRYV